MTKQYKRFFLLTKTFEARRQDGEKINSSTYGDKEIENNMQKR